MSFCCLKELTPDTDMNLISNKVPCGSYMNAHGHLEYMRVKKNMKIIMIKKLYYF